MAKKYIDESGLSVVFAKIKALIATKANTNHSHSAATQSAAGYMSAADKKKLDGISTGANKTTVDSSLSSTSTNPVQNKVINSALAGKAASGHGHDAATSSAAGFMSAADKSKLDGIAAGANAYTHPNTSGNKHIPAGGSSGQILRWSADGTAEWGADNNSDTKNTTGTTNKTGTKLFLAGATSQAANPTTYSNSNVYVTTDNGLAAKEFYRDGLGSTRVFGTLIPYGTAIAAETDLNTPALMKVGNYFCSANNTVATLINCPTGTAFMMQVLSPLSTTIDDEASNTWIYRLRKMQLYTGEEYVQYCYVGATAGTWTYGPWKKTVRDTDLVVATTEEIDTALAAVE